MPNFGVSGLSSTATDGFLRSLASSSITAFEVGFNSSLPESFPDKIRRVSKELGIQLNLHLPFFFGWSDQRKIDQSKRFLSDGARLASEVNGVAVFHLGYASKRRFEDVRSTIASTIHEAVESVRLSNPGTSFSLGIETTGKTAELGSLEEVFLLVNDLSSKMVIPIVDWSHLYARANGQFPRTVTDYRQVMDKLERVSDRNFYFHGSGIEFDNFQEKRHLSAKTCAPPLPHLIQVLEEGGYDYTLIVESPTAIDDVMWLKDVRRNPSAWIQFAEEKMRLSVRQATLG